jgi:DNA transformation protein
MQRESFLSFVLDQLAGLGGVASRAMFGGHGLYAGGRCFGIVFRGRLYFKVGAATRAAYTRRGMKPFRPNARQTLRSFHEVPADVLESAGQLCDWAGRAIACASASGASVD